MADNKKTDFRQDHGGDIFSRVNGRPVLSDFSASINPLGHPEGLLEALTERWTEILHYPDRQCRELKSAICKRYPVTEESILCGNGSAELIALLLQNLRINRLILCPPDFGLYEDSTPMTTEIVNVPRVEEKGFAVDLDRVLDTAAKGDLVLLSNPGNPSGATHSREDILSFLDGLSGKGAALLLDEAFADYSPEASVLDRAPYDPALMVLRSLTKFHGMPGLRLGFIAAHKDAIAHFANLQTPWSVSVPAQICGAVAMEDDTWAERSRQYLHRSKEKFVEELSTIDGYEVIPSGANYLLVKLSPPAPDGDAIYSKLRSEGTLVRHCASFGLGNRYLRFAVRTVGENTDLIRHLQRISREG